MPELPEVQTIVDDLNKKIKGKVIAGFWSDWDKVIAPDKKTFTKKIIGKKIENIKRRGKNILFYLSGEEVILVHLKMTGHLLVKNKDLKNKKDYFNEKVNQYIHHIFSLKGSKEKKPTITLEFSDLRKFGKIKLINKRELDNDNSLSKLGREPFAKDFNAKELENILKDKNTPIRKIIMDQNIIAGIGNIYASEILFEAKINPRTRAKYVDAKKLYAAIKKILKKAIKLRGTSDSDFRDTEGAPGNFQKILKVYRREGKPCKRAKCKGIIKREKINQRSSFWCPECQRQLRIKN